MNERQLIARLNAKTKDERLGALRSIKAELDGGGLEKPARTEDTNNHVHTMYSFSCYSPTAAVFKAYMSGLSVVGIVDHDSISGAREFVEAGEIIGIATTVGAEVRVSFAGTSVEGRRINSPDEPAVAYIALHGVPHNKIDELDALLSRIRTLRNERNAAQVERLNKILHPCGIWMDFEHDVLPLSMAAEGGSVTERHILFALAGLLAQKCGRGQGLIDFLEKEMRVPVSQKARAMLLDTDFYAYDYDVLNVLKAGLVPGFFIAGGADSLPVREVVEYARQLGGIPAYCYLGDVGESPTGDKKAQKFEDGYLDELMRLVKQTGFEAIAYMPTRNTAAQLARVADLCRHHGFMEISGEDINQPRQSFVCEKLRAPEFARLADGAWALVGHERATEKAAEDSIYSQKTKHGYPSMELRIARYREIGLQYRG